MALLSTCMLAALLAAPPSVRPAPLQGRGAWADSEGRAELVRADGGVQIVPLREFAARDFVQLDCVIVRFGGLRPPRWDDAAPDRAHIVLASGDGLSGRLLGGSDDAFEIELLGGVPYSVLIDFVASVVFPARIPDGWSSPLVPAEEGDRLYRRQGEGLDQLDGTVQELLPDGVRFHGVLGSRVLPWSDVAALFVESLGEAPAPQADGGTLVVVDLYDLSRVRGRLERVDADGVRLERARSDDDRGALVLPLHAVAAIARDDASVAFLSDLEPAEVVEGSPFDDDLGMRWPHRRDLSVTGEPLIAGGRIYTRGLGVHAPSRLVWQLGEGGWRRLVGSVAVDDQVLRLGKHGSVVFRVLVDGETAFESPIQRGGDAPLRMPEIDLSGASELALEVDTADELFIADRADWLDMLLVR